MNPISNCVFNRLLLIGALCGAGVSAQSIFFQYTKTGFFAMGSWESPDPKVKSDMTETQIDCFKERKMCVMATADNFMGRPHVNTNYMDVIKWDDDGLIATDSSPICMSLTLQVTVADKHITLLHSIKRLEKEQADACKAFGLEKSAEDVFVLKRSPRWEKEHTWIPNKSDESKP